MKTKIRKCLSAKEKNQTRTHVVPPTLEQIRQRAHEIFMARGGASGNDLDDWLRAEQELKQQRAAAKAIAIPPMNGARYETTSQVGY